MKRYFIILIFLTYIQIIYAQKITISGYVSDAKTGERLIGVNIYDRVSKKGTQTNNFGFYSISISKGDSINLIFSYIGYKEKVLALKSQVNIVRNLKLIAGYNLQEININAEKITHSLNVVSIPMRNIEVLPSLTGEKDILKAYTLLPGVQSGKEGTSDLYVRGGSPDQNLVLLDDVPVYYLNHIGGFVSIFDENVINRMNLIKGGFPARYAGRLSSVLDIRLKDGNLKTYHGEISIGIISSRLSLQGPIKKGKTSFIVSARRCNLDLFTRIIDNIDGLGVSGGYTFYDINAKINHKFNENNQLNAVFYKGRDKLFFKVKDAGDIYLPFQNSSDYSFYNSENVKWGNILGSLRWNHRFNDKLFGNLIFAYTKFNFQSINELTETYIPSDSLTGKYVNDFGSNVEDFILKNDYDLYANRSHFIKFGFKAVFHNFSPGYTNFLLVGTPDSDTDTTFKNAKVNSLELGIYIEDEWQIGNLLKANLGIHSAAYYVDNALNYSIQPRLNMLFTLPRNTYLSASFAQMNQYIHLLSSTDEGLPTNLWVPATQKVPDEKSYQYTLGFAHFLRKSKLKLSVEGFYKELTGLINLKHGSNLFITNESWDKKIAKNGKGTVYGLEFLLQKSYGKFTGWIAYTYSKNTRQFDSLNAGVEYPYDFDRTHDLSIVAQYKLNDNINFSATWVYGTGFPVTLSYERFSAIDMIKTEESGYQYSANTGFYDSYIYTEKNNYRLSAYHRLDVAANFIKKKKRGIRTWSVSIYNVYNHLNSYFVYINKDIYGEYHFYRFSMFPVIPSVSYSFVF